MAEEPEDPTAHFVHDEVVAAFNVFDVKKEGKLPPTPEALLPLMRSLGFDSITTSEIELMLFDMGARDKGGIDVESLVPAVAKKKAERAEGGYTDEQVIRNALFSLDPNGGDFYSADEFRMKLMCTGEKLSEEDVNSLIKLGDPAGIGKIDVPGLVTMLFNPPKKKKKKKKKKK
ncbi:uncharacterized protein MONOS_17329 [Monocercomonoides exilis]|uniref:uncharacterized protein n=1 Tax=Monocercomonoides exilis TaxID=2049356 RepID=UPI00355ACB99|nr:hypothetical protein MONOS_17329 [Monocercomonoides exilis]